MAYEMDWQRDHGEPIKLAGDGLICGFYIVGQIAWIIVALLLFMSK